MFAKYNSVGRPNCKCVEVKEKTDELVKLNDTTPLADFQ